MTLLFTFLCSIFCMSALSNSEQSCIQSLQSALAERLYGFIITADFSYQAHAIFDEDSSFTRLKGEPLPEEYQELIRNVAKETGYWQADKLQIYWMNFPLLEADQQAFTKGFLTSIYSHEISINPLLLGYCGPELVLDLCAEFFALRTYAGPTTQFSIALGSAICSYAASQKITALCSGYAQTDTPSWLTKLAGYTGVVAGFCGTVYLAALALRKTITTTKDTYLYKRFVRNYFFESGRSHDLYKEYLIRSFEQTGHYEHARKLAIIASLETEYTQKTSAESCA